MDYCRLHRFLLRSISSRGILSVTEADASVKSISDETDVSIADMVRAINNEIRPFQQMIKTVNDELSNEEKLVFISLGCDEATKSQNIFSATELEYFKILLEEIMTTASRQISGIHAINLVGKMKGNLTKISAQKLLNTWCRMFYLDKEQSNYALGVRAIHEFESYFRQNLPDTIEDCCLCKQVVFRGFNCPACNNAVHTRCLNRYLEKVEKWPCCKIDFSSSQLEQLNSSRFAQTQQDNLEQSEEYNTVDEPNEMTEESIADTEMSQQTTVGISQCVTRKRKRQRE